MAEVFTVQLRDAPDEVVDDLHAAREIRLLTFGEHIQWLPFLHHHKRRERPAQTQVPVNKLYTHWLVEPIKSLLLSKKETSLVSRIKASNKYR